MYVCKYLNGKEEQLPALECNNADQVNNGFRTYHAPASERVESTGNTSLGLTNWHRNVWATFRLGTQHFAHQ